jgi:hypothetical protein
MPKGYHNNHIRGHKHYQWNNNRIISSHGYARIRVGVGHPLADPNGYAYEHLLVVLTTNSPEANLIRQCPSKHLIHHINGDKTDNRIENLQVMERAVHNAFHNAEKKGRKPLTT